MKRELLMSIDLGTQSTRAALLDLDGTMVASARRLHDMQTPYPGWAEQDPTIWWQNTVACIGETIAHADATEDEILGIGVGGQMHGTVPLSSTGELLSHEVQLWCEKRSANSAYHQTANPPVANWIGFKIKWLQQHKPKLYTRTWKFVVPKDYVNYRLTGIVSIDYSEASGSFLMDADTRQWSDEIIQGMDLDRQAEVR